MAKQCITLTAADLEDAVRETARVLADGGVALFPTETVYGIGVASGNAQALQTLRRLKARTPDKPFQYLAADVQMAENLGARFSTRAARLARAFWPGPMTLVVPDGTRDDSTLGIRIPSSPFVLALCRELGRPIIASSANAAGSEPPLTAAAADVFGDEADILIDGGTIVDGIPSTVVCCRDDAFEIIRPGGVDEESIRDAWAE